MKTYKGGVRHDYNKKQNSPDKFKRKGHWVSFTISLVLPVLLMITFFSISSIMQVGESIESPIITRNQLIESFPQSLDSINLPLPEFQSPQLQNLEIENSIEILLLVKPGDSLESLFQQHTLSIADLGQITQLNESMENLEILLPGEEIAIEYSPNRRVISLTKSLNETKILKIFNSTSGFQAEILERDIEIRKNYAHGIIQSSLFEAGKVAGVTDTVIMNMAGIFQWDIDFIQDVRIGDEFTVIFEEYWHKGEKIKTGEILAAEFVNQGEPYRAARYTDSNSFTDYYMPEGRSVRKAFIRAPVDFTRISSNFNLNRRHPVLNTIRAHKGVDYAAPSGTPVMAAGDGVVKSIGDNGGYGNTIVIQHGSNITTLYAHLSRFANSISKGSRVTQGQTIGYVGQSGLTTGPHLHYEYRLNGVHRNPRTVNLPLANPINEENFNQFTKNSSIYWDHLDLIRRIDKDIT
ncbi:MAG: hypothetical protein CBC38_07870 [Gammaproteobacteria bacterium TMED78]|nr:MAG: hypothetical protein CBC38_07870 [Gammaproteobacteria bacterium TMED78]